MRRVLIVLLLVVAVLPSAGADPPPAAVTDLAAVYTPEDATIDLSWTAPGSGSYRYEVYRGTTYLGDTTGTTYVDSSPDFVIGAYTVTAVLGGVEGAEAFLVVPSVAPCTPMAVQSRFHALLVTPTDPCAGTIPGQCVAGGASTACVPTACEAVTVSILPPGADIHEQCVPVVVSGKQTYQFQVVS